MQSMFKKYKDRNEKCINFLENSPSWNKHLFQWVLVKASMELSFWYDVKMYCHISLISSTSSNLLPSRWLFSLEKKRAWNSVWQVQRVCTCIILRFPKNLNRLQWIYQWSVEYISNHLWCTASQRWHKIPEWSKLRDNLIIRSIFLQN